MTRATQAKNIAVIVNGEFHDNPNNSFGSTARIIGLMYSTVALITASRRQSSNCTISSLWQRKTSLQTARPGVYLQYTMYRSPTCTQSQEHKPAIRPTVVISGCVQQLSQVDCTAVLGAVVSILSPWVLRASNPSSSVLFP
jgi:hypothetical protein